MLRWMTLALAIGLAGAARAEPVDLELVLAADGSGSIDTDELLLQRKGYADALASKPVLDAIQANPNGRIAVLYLEWGGPSSQDVVVDWTVIQDEASARDFGTRLLAAPRRSTGYNSISNAIVLGHRLMDTNAHEGVRRVIDVSGDGPNIGGVPIETARQAAVDAGITINALAVRRPGSGVAFSSSAMGMPLEDYYKAHVIGGTGAFVEIAGETKSFEEAVRSKLVLEIAHRGGDRQRAAVD